MQANTRLLVMRHAKAGDLPGGPDAERALNARGRREASAAGQWLRDEGLVPDAVICSAARRARQTWQQVAAELGQAVPASHDPRLYGADKDQLLEIIGQTPDSVATLLYIGHNPAADELVAALTSDAGWGLATAAIAVIDMPGPWQRASPGEGQLAAFWAPRVASES